MYKYEVYQIRHHARGSSKAKLRKAVKKFPLKMHSEDMSIAKNQGDIWTLNYYKVEKLFSIFKDFLK